MNDGTLETLAIAAAAAVGVVILLDVAARWGWDYRRIGAALGPRENPATGNNAGAAT